MKPIQIIEDIALVCFFVSQVIGHWTLLGNAYQRRVERVGNWSAYVIVLCLIISVINWVTR